MADLELDLSDPEALSAAFNKLESGEELQQSPPAQTAEATETKPEERPAAKDDAAQSQEHEAAGVATKDGKNIIPYAVLKNERERAARAEQVARELQQRVADLEARTSAANQGANTGESARTGNTEAPASDLSPEDLEALKEDFPTVYKAVMASMAKAQELETKLRPVEERVQSAEAEQARSAAETVQDAIDSIPKLAHIQASNEEAFALAKQFDATLRAQSKWANAPLAERFQKVTEMVEAAFGEIELPGATTSQQSAEQLRVAALAKAASAAKANKTAVPTSLSEFPAGESAAQDELEAIERLSPQQLAEKLGKMSPDQMDAYFQSL